MKILLVDDEPLARERLAELLHEIGGHEVLARLSSGSLALEFCAKNEVDVVLLDIHMPGLSGIETAQKLSAMPHPPWVVFITAYDEHALEAFDAKAMDYLLKPVRLERLQAALEKVAPLVATRTREEKDEAYLSVTFRGGLERIALASVFYLRADSKYVVVRHPRGEALMETSLKSFADQHPENFVRIHRNALVACDKVRGLERDLEGQAMIVFDGIDDKIAISRRHLPAVRRWLREN